MDYELIDKNSESFMNYCDVLTDMVFKILPLLEEGNEGASKYVDSLLFELLGVNNVVRNVGEDARYISLVSTLSSIADEVYFEDIDLSLIKREVFKCISLVNKIKNN